MEIFPKNHLVRIGSVRGTDLCIVRTFCLEPIVKEKVGWCIDEQTCPSKSNQLVKPFQTNFPVRIIFAQSYAYRKKNKHKKNGLSAPCKTHDPIQTILN